MTDSTTWGIGNWRSDATLTLKLLRLTSQCIASLKTLKVSCFLLTAVVWIEDNRKTIARRDWVPYRSNFKTILDFFISRWGKKLVGVRSFFRQLGTRSSGRCRCREVETRSNVWTVPWDKKVAFIEWWPLWRGGPWWRIDCILLLLTDCVKYWRTSYCLIGILTYWINNWLAYWRRLGLYFTEWMTWLDSTVWLDCMFLLVDFFISVNFTMKFSNLSCLVAIP